MTLLVAGLVLFLGLHSISIVSASWRDRQVALRGEKAWKGGYTIVSLVGFACLVYGYALARQAPVVLYDPPRALRHLSLLLMLPVFPLLFATYLPGRLQALAKHPMLLATKLWAFAHLLANGTLADVLLFGGFLAWAVADRISLKRRAARPIARAPTRAINDVIAIVGGLAVYVAFVLFLHRWLIGVSPLGR